MTPKNKIACAALLTAIFGLGVPAAVIQYRQSLGSLDLAEAQRGSTAVVDHDGKLLRAFTTPDDRWRLPVSVQNVDPRFIAMLLAFEDRRFQSHHGVDFEALGRAAVQWVTSGHIVSGGSTLTMQVARLLARYQDAAPDVPPGADENLKPQDQHEERSLSAKLRQIVRAWDIERHATKAQVLDLYLALAPYGGNLEGVRAASLAYFGKEPKRLSIAEAALLVALPQSPETRRPDHFAENARAARDKVLARVAEAGMITKAEQDFARVEPVPMQRRAFPALAPHASEAAWHADPHARVIKLTLDAKLQAAMEGLAHDGAQRLGPKLSAAILVVDNATGAILAHVSTADYLSQERSGAIDMTQAVRSPGSALKPFIYALAFENGVAHPETILDDRPSRYGLYAPQNFDLSYQGTVTARRALQLSLNVPRSSFWPKPDQRGFWRACAMREPISYFPLTLRQG